MIRFFRSRAMAATIAIAALFAFGNAANAQVVPFKVNGSGSAPNGASVFGFDSPHSATGKGTHIGKYSGDGVFNSLSFNPSTGSGTFHGTFTFVAKNGDQLACTYGETANGAEEAGTYQAYPTSDGKVFIVFIAEFNPIPSECTGRFKNVVDGSFIMVAISEPFPLELDENGFTPKFSYTWEGKGWMKYQRGK